MEWGVREAGFWVEIAEVQDGLANGDPSVLEDFESKNFSFLLNWEFIVNNLFAREVPIELAGSAGLLLLQGLPLVFSIFCGFFGLLLSLGLWEENIGLFSFIVVAF